MTIPDELTYDRAAARIVRFMLAIGALGTVSALARWGWQSGAGFFLGSLISGLNFLLLKKLIDRMGGEREAARPRRRSVFLAMRYLALGAGAYAILKLSPVSLPAVLAGIFVFTAAVIVEVAVEIYLWKKVNSG